jgi:hypothetical protein
VLELEMRRGEYDPHAPLTEDIFDPVLPEQHVATARDVVGKMCLRLM